MANNVVTYEGGFVVLDQSNTAGAAVVRDSNKSINITGINNSGASVAGQRTVTGTASAVASDKIIFGDAAAAAFAYTLPAAGTSAGREIEVVKVDSSGNAVTVKGAGAELINGSNTLALPAQYNATRVRCNGTQWYVI